MLRFMGIDRAAAGREHLRCALGGILLLILLVVALLALGWGIVKLVALPFGGIDTASRSSGASCWSRRARRARVRGPAPAEPRAREGGRAPPVRGKR